jgi:hypothetical protein
MSLPSIAAKPDMESQRSHTADTRLTGHWLVVARVSWVVFTVPILLVFAASLRAYFALLHLLCRTTVCALGQLTPSTARALQALGISISDYALFMVTLIVVTALVCFAIAIVLVWRKSDEWMVLLVAFWLVMQAATAIVDLPTLSHALGEVLAPVYFTCFNFLAAVVFSFVLALFPTGRFVPRWTGFLVVGLIVYSTLFLFEPPSTYLQLLPLSNTLYFGSGLILAGAQIYRYRLCRPRCRSTRSSGLPSASP